MGFRRGGCFRTNFDYQHSVFSRRLQYRTVLPIWQRWCFCQLFEVAELLLSLALGILQKRDSAFKKSIQGMWTLYVSDMPCTFLESTSIGCFEGCLISKEFAPALSFGKAPVSRHMFSAK